MQGAFFWIVVAVSLCIFFSCIPAEAANGGSSLSDDQGHAGSVSTGSPDAAPGNGDIASSASGSGTTAGDIQEHDPGITTDLGISEDSRGSGSLGGYGSSASGIPSGSGSGSETGTESSGRQETGSDAGLETGNNFHDEKSSGNGMTAERDWGLS
ncbi:MAG: hypothetical protein LUQ33_04935, partial [Methanoregulaceae archaeon]|nr:hypothetical protein [Methanoregulaceae archaeon]